MSSKQKYKKTENILIDSRNGQALVDTEHQNTTVKSKVDFIFGAVPSRSKNDILLVLQSCEYNVESAISIFSQGRADDILNQWSHIGKKSKDVIKRRNKKKLGSINAKELEPKKEDRKTNEKQIKLLAEGSAHASDVQNSHTSDLLKPEVPTELKFSTTTIVHPSETTLNGISTSSPGSLSSSGPATPCEEPEKLPSKHIEHSHHPSLHHKTKKNHNHHPKVEKPNPTTGFDALKKTTKDLSRSSVSLARYQLVVEEECEESFKRITKIFENIRNCITEREAALTSALKEFKEEAVKLLQQRSEDAAALKLKTERVHSMSEEQIALLRTDIRGFVAERKIDEELAQTKRFICDEENLLQGIKTFGEIVPIKSTYTPVVLNHPTPSPTPKLVSSKTPHVNDISVAKPPSKSQPFDAAKKSEHLAVIKEPEPTSPLITQRNTGTNDRPPKIESLISSAMEKSALAVGNLHDAAEMHSKLVEALKQQGVTSQYEVKKEHQNQEDKQQERRPTTAPHQLGKQQDKKHQEQRSHRVQSSRQGSRSYQRQNKDENTNKLNETSETDVVRAKTNQRGASGRNETGKEGSNERFKATDGRRSTLNREWDNRRPPRSRKPKGEKPNKGKINGEKAEKEPVVNSKDGRDKAGFAERKSHEEQEHAESKNETSAGNDLTDRALPQRRNQNRRRFREHDKESEHESGKQLENGETNCLVDNHTTNDKVEKAEEIPPRKDKTAKFTLESRPMINGHNEANEKAEKILKHESHKSNTQTENMQVNGFSTSNGNGEDCMAER